MSKNKIASDKVITLVTDNDDIIGTLQAMEPGPIFVQPVDTPEGPGVYLCNESFTLEEAEKQFNADEDNNEESEYEEVSLDAMDEDEF